MEAILPAVIKIVLAVFMTLFPVVNPIGTALMLSEKSQTVPPDIMKKISIKIAIYSFFVLSIFFLFGFLFLKLFGITTQIVQVSGGLVLTAMAWQMLNSSSFHKNIYNLIRICHDCPEITKGGDHGTKNRASPIGVVR